MKGGIDGASLDLSSRRYHRLGDHRSLPANPRTPRRCYLRASSAWSRRPDETVMIAGTDAIELLEHCNASALLIRPTATSDHPDCTTSVPWRLESSFRLAIYAAFAILC